MNDRVDVQEPRARLDFPDAIHRMNRGAHELGFQFESAIAGKRINRTFIAGGPREIGNLVYRHEKSGPVHLLAEPAGKRGAEISQGGYEFRFEDIEMIWPAEMAQV